jgi:hypothetical protein
MGVASFRNVGLPSHNVLQTRRSFWPDSGLLPLPAASHRKARGICGGRRRTGTHDLSLSCITFSPPFQECSASTYYYRRGPCGAEYRGTQPQLRGHMRSRQVAITLSIVTVTDSDPSGCPRAAPKHTTTMLTHTSHQIRATPRGVRKVSWGRVRNYLGSLSVHRDITNEAITRQRRHLPGTA